METDLTTDLIGFVAGAILAVCFLPQVIRTLKTRTAEDVSMSSAQALDRYLASFRGLPGCFRTGETAADDVDRVHMLIPN